MTKGVVIYAPQGAGKTTNAHRLAAFYGKTVILDDWPAWKPGDSVPDDAIVLTSQEGVPGAILLETALRLLRDREG